MLLIKKGRFWEPTMCMKTHELDSITHDVDENKRVDVSGEAKIWLWLGVRLGSAVSASPEYTDTICDSASDGGRRIPASRLRNAVPCETPQLTTSRVAIGNLSR